jgi:muramoyltetrapeptide carboxypeptidase
MKQSNPRHGRKHWIEPPFLKPGDRIAVTCPASKMDRQVAETAASIIEGWGFRVLLGDTVGAQYHNFSAPDEQRCSELQHMLDEDSIRAVIFGRGGYGMLRIIDKLDFSRLRRKPKWICGYSDITALHNHLGTCLGMESFHSVMCSGITSETGGDPYVDSLRRSLTGERMAYSFSAHPLNRTGTASGTLVGGNLSLLVSLAGTISQPDTRGKILFLEDVGEYRYAVDRMMIQLQRAGWLQGISALVVGGFTDYRETEEPFGQTEYEIIQDKVSELDFPVAFGFPAGHQRENYTLKMGGDYTVVVGETCMLKENE